MEVEPPPEEKPRFSRHSISYELGRMDSMLSTGSNDSMSSVEIEDNFVGMNLDKNLDNNYNEKTKNDAVSLPCLEKKVLHPRD